MNQAAINEFEGLVAPTAPLAAITSAIRVGLGFRSHVPILASVR